MSNMSYCRLQNTLSDLKDCADNWDEELSPEEARAKKKMIQLMLELTQNVEEDES